MKNLLPSALALISVSLSFLMPVTGVAAKATPPAIPVFFIENGGQADARIDYYVTGKNKSVYFNSQGVTYSLSDDQTAGRRWNVKLDFVNASPKAAPVGTNATPATISYFKGPRSAWKTKLKTYGGLKYSNLWKGIDLAYSGEKDRLEYRFVVQPGADPQKIRMAYRGAKKVLLNANGALEIQTPMGGFEEGSLMAYQEKNGRRERVTANFAVKQEAGRSVVGFRLGAYDRKKPLIIDPTVFLYGGLLGGDGDDVGLAIAADGAGNAYVTGWTASTESTFPVTVGPSLAKDVFSRDAFVAKVKADGTGLDYAGFIGGDANETGVDIAVDAAGNAYVTGFTTSDGTTFPVTAGPDVSYNDGGDAFVAKVKADGTGLDYAGFIGGAGVDYGYGIAVDGAGNAYLAGFTASSETTFPDGDGFGTLAGPDPSHNGGINDAFVAKIKADGTGLVYAGYVGGNQNDYGRSIAVDAAGNAYVTGFTESSDFPATADGFGPAWNGGSDAFVAKINAAGSGLDYAGFLGGAGDEESLGIALDAAGNAYITGDTDSTETGTPPFPVTAGPDLTANGGTDAFVAKVSADGHSLVYSGFLGGGSYDEGDAIAVDVNGNAYVTGYTDSTENDTPPFPVVDGPDLTANGSGDAFVAKISADGLSIASSGFIGGTLGEGGSGIAVDEAGNAYVTGYTTSDDFSATSGSFGETPSAASGDKDVFVVKIGFRCGDGVVDGTEACDIGGGASDTCASGSSCVAAGQANECTCQSSGGTTAGTTGGTGGTAEGTTSGGTSGTDGESTGDAANSGGCSLTPQ